MLRASLVLLCRVVLRVFFRRIEVVGAESLPTSGPVIFIVNHPNGLVDPLFVLCLSGRRVSFLAKEPLFRMFLVGAFVRAFECLPVYRKQDGGDPAKNRRAIGDAVALLERGNAIAIFPEGTSHSDASLKPLKPGAARMALAATARNAEQGLAPVAVVPIGLNYTRKSSFRSDALMVYGPPVLTPVVGPCPEDVPPASAVAEHTATLTQALAAVTLQAESVDTLHWAVRIERIGRAVARDDAPASAAPQLHERHRWQRRIIDAYRAKRVAHPQAVEAMETAIVRFEQRMLARGLEPDQHLSFSRLQIVTALLEMLALVCVLVPLALVGVVMNYATYRLVGALAFRLSKQEDDVVATFKVIAGLLSFPMTWACWGALAGWLGGWTTGLWVAGCGPVGAYAALIALERGRERWAEALAAAMVTLRPGIATSIRRERTAIWQALRALEDGTDG